MFRKSMDVVLIVSLFSVIVQSAGIPINRFLDLNPVVCRYTRGELEMSNGSHPCRYTSQDKESGWVFLLLPGRVVGLGSG